ncbi:A33 protein, partial [Hydrobates tethys]|nr:A33 protein [Oceanodroma tethys]
AGMAGKSQEQSLLEELTCAICCELFREPVMLDCMHHFCRACIQGYWESCAHVPSCPQCRREFPSRAFRTHYLLSGLVEKVRRGASVEHRQKMRVSGFCSAGGEGDGPKPITTVYSVEALGRGIKHSLMQRLQGALVQQSRGRVSGLCKQINGPSHPMHLLVCFSCQTHRLPFPSAQKVSGELNFKIRGEFARLHQILEEEERAVLAELGEKEEQSLARLHGDVHRLEERMLVLQRDIEHIEQTLSKMEEVSLLEVGFLSLCCMTAGGRTGSLFVQLHELQTVTANSFCSSLQVESLDIRYVSGMKEADSPPAPLTFDPESAHPNLIFSRDLTAVTERNRAQPVPSSPRRFRQCVNVLSSQTFDSGRHYWEVWVGSKTKWDLGVAAEAVDRAVKVKLCPENGYWTLRLRNRTEYWATATPWVRLTPRQPPRKVGVFLDCQEGTVTFFDARDMSHLFTFHQVSAERYCPFFSTCFSDGMANMEPMRLCHVAL